jgi:hypothetical protein
VEDMKNNINLIAAHADRVLQLESASLGDEYYYQSLPLCVIDAVYSIGVRYEGIKNVVARYCERFDLQRIRATNGAISPAHEQESITAFCEKAERIGPANMAIDVYRNRQRTSAINGILKADAVLRFAAVLRKYNIEYLQDISAAIGNIALEKDIRSIPGQSSGISLKYFLMLAGSDDLIKPDRMILGFLGVALGRLVSPTESQDLLTAAVEQLRDKYPSLTPRLLDHEVWKYQRDQKTPKIIPRFHDVRSSCS